ncbi:hypothetical protein T069G_08316 [Trichoderma breve]|uniref:Uncharacterized protein n=1 Tax=Trichoderma breve TaxID=2034170 RepID=A0A9W9E437_9HYPO|nr:hypothetical protein T069G_08316 [Trichoderma breve]KAJ4857419.1 hypothetical protein T069G_08316 [Trichoderma breve]
MYQVGLVFRTGIAAHPRPHSHRVRSTGTGYLATETCPQTGLDAALKPQTARIQDPTVGHAYTLAPTVSAPGIHHTVQGQCGAVRVHAGPAGFAIEPVSAPAWLAEDCANIHGSLMSQQLSAPSPTGASHPQRARISAASVDALRWLVPANCVADCVEDKSPAACRRLALWTHGFTPRN